MIFAVPRIAFVLFRKNWMEDISFWNTRGFAFAKSDVALYFVYNGSVTRFTTLSVHCAERMTETRNWNGVWYVSSLFGFGYIFLRYATMARARARRRFPGISYDHCRATVPNWRARVRSPRLIRRIPVSRHQKIF